MPRRSAKDAAETRERILESGRALFTAHGFDGAKTAEIARAAGVTEGAFFHHFRDKKRLYRAIVERLQGDYDAAVRAESAQGRSPLDATMRGCRAALSLATEPSFARIVMLYGPSVLGEAEWREIDSGKGLLTAEIGVRAVLGANAPGTAEVRAMAVALLGMLNETIFALVRQETGVDAGVSAALIERTLKAWAGSD
jgi:AcrR family transcriptional regulator